MYSLYIIYIYTVYIERVKTENMTEHCDNVFWDKKSCISGWSSTALAFILGAYEVRLQASFGAFFMLLWCFFVRVLHLCPAWPWCAWLSVLSLTSSRPTAMDSATPRERSGLLPWVTGQGSLCSSPKRSVRFMSTFWTGCKNLGTTNTQLHLRQSLNSCTNIAMHALERIEIQ